MKTKKELLADSIQPGSIVYFNNLNDAAPFEVISRDHNTIIIRDIESAAENPEIANQRSDVSLVSRVDAK